MCGQAAFTALSCDAEPLYRTVAPTSCLSSGSGLNHCAHHGHCARTLCGRGNTGLVIHEDTLVECCMVEIPGGDNTTKGQGINVICMYCLYLCRSAPTLLFLNL